MLDKTTINGIIMEARQKWIDAGRIAFIEYMAEEDIVGIYETTSRIEQIERIAINGQEKFEGNTYETEYYWHVRELLSSKRVPKMPVQVVS